MNPQYDEHLRDSAPAPKPSLAKRMLISLGLFAGRGLPLMPQLQMPTAIVPVHTCSGERRVQRKLCRELGRRQYRRATRRSYALKAEAALLGLA